MYYVAQARGLNSQDGRHDHMAWTYLSLQLWCALHKLYKLAAPNQVSPLFVYNVPCQSWSLATSWQRLLKLCSISSCLRPLIQKFFEHIPWFSHHLVRMIPRNLTWNLVVHSRRRVYAFSKMHDLRTATRKPITCGSWHQLLYQLLHLSILTITFGPHPINLPSILLRPRGDWCQD